MLTRSAQLRQFLEEDNSTTISVNQSDSSQAESEDSTQPTSIRTFISNPRMEEANAALAAPLRKKLERVQGKVVRCKDKLSRQRDQENPSASDFETLKEAQSLLDLHHKEHEKISTELYELETNPTAIAEDELKADEFDSNLSTVVRDCRYLLSQRSIYSNIQSLESVIRGLTTAYEITRK